jgi:hypothetical protein
MLRAPNPKPMKEPKPITAGGAGCSITTSASPKLKHLVVVGKFDDGKCRQVLISPKAQDVILSAILACEGQIRALEPTLDGLDIGLPS